MDQISTAFVPFFEKIMAPSMLTISRTMQFPSLTKTGLLNVVAFIKSLEFFERLNFVRRPLQQPSQNVMSC
ncbi:hypothetical protein AJ88_21970 [Mesorhizobium amorphae CCBAU 01583]|nr:hypothetical protein AJ88_21970 [Mesorhizobium amorphae CCBAU 01583]